MQDQFQSETQRRVRHFQDQSHSMMMVRSWDTMTKFIFLMLKSMGRNTMNPKHSMLEFNLDPSQLLGSKWDYQFAYDLRFPELYRSEEFTDVELISVPSAFTKETGEAHWLTLLQSRAIENLAYIIAPNQWGEHYGSRETFGHSVIIDPWGKIIELIKDGEGFVLAEIDTEGLQSIRKKFPALDHRRIK